MATFIDLFNLKTNTDLRNKVAVAITIRAKDFVLKATPTGDEIAWANKALENPLSQADKIMNYLLASNSSLTVNQIETASDATIQTKVNEVVDKLISVL